MLLFVTDACRLSIAVVVVCRWYVCLVCCMVFGVVGCARLYGVCCMSLVVRCCFMFGVLLGVVGVVNWSLFVVRCCSSFVARCCYGLDVRC